MYFALVFKFMNESSEYVGLQGDNWDDLYSVLNKNVPCINPIQDSTIKC